MYGFPIEVKIRKSMWIMVVADEVPSSVSASSNSSGQDKVKEFLMKWHF